MDNGGPLPEDPRGTLMTGIVMENGDSEWVYLYDEMLPTTLLEDHHVRFLSSGEVLEDNPASVREIADGDALSVTVAVPELIEEVDEITLVGPDRLTSIDVDQIDRISLVSTQH